MLSALPPVLDFTACPRLCRLVSTLLPVLGFHACSRLCSLFTALFPVLNFLACPQLWRLLPALLHVLVFATWYQLLYLTPASIPHLGHHPPWLGYSARKLAFGQTPHVGWPSGLRPSAIIILQCAASLAAGGYNRPCGPIESLFLLSPARILDGRARLYSSELSYSCIDRHLHHNFFMYFFFQQSKNRVPNLNFGQSKIMFYYRTFERAKITFHNRTCEQAKITAHKRNFGLPKWTLVQIYGYMLFIWTIPQKKNI